MTIACDPLAASTWPRASATRRFPRLVQEAAIQAIHDGHNIYTRLDGIARLRKAIAAKQQRDYGLDYDPETRDPGFLGRNRRTARRCHGSAQPRRRSSHLRAFLRLSRRPLSFAARQSNFCFSGRTGFRPRRRRPYAAVTPKTRAILLNTPANPSGKVFTSAELETIADVVLEHDLFLITDEIYEYFVYDGARHICPATLPGMKERTIVLSGFSQDIFSDWLALGYVTADAKWIAADGLLSRPDLCLRPLGFSARGGCGP